MGSAGSRERGSGRRSERGALTALSTAEAVGISHELTEDPAARFFRVAEPSLPEGEAGAASGVREGDTLVVQGDARPNEGDLIVVRLEGNGHLLARSRRQGAWCLLAGGAAVPMEAGGSVQLEGVVVGVLRKVPNS